MGISRSLPATSANPISGWATPPGNAWPQTVDLIVHPAAHVNHVLPYRHLFAPNVAGTAEVIRLAMTGKLKPIALHLHDGRQCRRGPASSTKTPISAARYPPASSDDGYANGYGISKWAGEVLMREAHDLCGLPVAVFRPGMILADSRYAGQLNVPDIFTRLLFSVVATGSRAWRRSTAPDDPDSARTTKACRSTSSPRRSPPSVRGTVRVSPPTTPPTRTTTESPWTHSSTGSSRRVIPSRGSTITRAGWLGSRHRCAHCPKGSVPSRF